jgi:Zn finger protein HypA/HybF involved in hydrogenase expression
VRGIDLHDHTVAEAIVRQALAQAARQGLGAIGRVAVEVSPISHLSLPSLEHGFEECAAGTPAQGAELRLTLRDLPAVCLDCGRELTVARPEQTCPGCGRKRLRLGVVEEYRVVAVEPREET